MLRSVQFATLSTVVFLNFSAIPQVLAAGKGDGACAINRSEIFSTSRGQQVIATAEVGDCVAGLTVRAGGLFGEEFLFEEENGRVHVAFVLNKDEKGFHRRGWMNPADLSRFAYDCGCGSLKAQRAQCTPFSEVGLFPMVQVYNACFKEGQERKKAELQSQVVTSTTPRERSSDAKRADKALANDDILTLVKVGLDDQLIITKIQEAPIIDFDLSTDGIVALKTAKISNAVIEAMMKRTSSRK